MSRSLHHHGPSASRSPFRLRLALGLAWAAALTYLSLAPEVKVPAGVPAWDKLHHFAAYALLALLLLRAVAVRCRPSGLVLLAAWIACSGYGFLLEILQQLMENGRQMEWGDQLANTLGALAACVLFRHMARRSLQATDEQ